MAGNNQSISKWSAIYQEDKIWTIFLCILISVNRKSYEITFVCSSLASLVGQLNIFFRSHWLVFPDLFIKLHYLIWELNSVFAENLFTLIFGQQKIQNYSILHLFWKFYNLVFLKGVWKENYCDTWNPTRKSMYGKIPVLKLLPKILSTDQIAAF